MVDRFDAEHLPAPRSNGFTQLRALSDMLDRARIARSAGITFEGERDLYSVLGYKRSLEPKDYRERYNRGGIAARIVEAFPKATWRGGLELVEDEDPETTTAFEEAWEELNTRLGILRCFARADILAGLGPYSVILIGAEGELHEPLENVSSPEGLLYLAPYGPDEAKVARLVSDTTDERFGLPEVYKITRQMAGNQRFEKDVHWSRVIHVVDGQLDDRVNGTPRLQRAWNYLDDLDKVAGGGSEAFWLRVHQGFAVKIDKDVDMTPTEVTALKDAAEEFAHQMRRTIAMRGAEFESMGSDVANIKNQVEALMSLISGATGIPQRILLGSERGELASSQDKENWDERVQDRREEFAEPHVRQFIDRLVGWGVLPGAKWNIRWPEIEELNEKERAEVAAIWAGLNSKASGPVVTPAEIRDRVLQLPELSDEEIAEWEERHQRPDMVGEEGGPDPSSPVDPEGGGGQEEGSPPPRVTRAAESPPKANRPARGQ